MKFKKIIPMFIVSALLSVALGAFCACAKDKAKEFVVSDYNSFITYGIHYTDDAECPSGNIKESKLRASRAFALSETNYAVIDLTLKQPRENGWADCDRFYVNIGFTPAELLDVTVNEVASSEVKETTEGEMYNVNISYKVPELDVTEKSYRITVQFRAEERTVTNIDLSVYSDKEQKTAATTVGDSFVIGGGEGFSPGFYFKENESGEGYEFHANNSFFDIKYCVIPKYHSRKPVVAVDSNVFDNFKGFTKIFIPNTVREIRNNSYINADKGEWERIIVEEGNEVYFGSGNCVIERESKTLILGCNASVIPADGSVEKVGEYAFKTCRKLPQISIPNSVTWIGSDAFNSCETLESIVIPDSVTEIGWNAFAYCGALKNITLPDGIALGEGVRSSSRGCVFSGTAYFNNEENWENGVLYIGSYLIYADKSKMEGGRYAVKEGTERIASYAFSGAEELSGIDLPDSVTHIGSFAFQKCNRLASIEFSENMKYIGLGAFEDGVLSSITFKGTTEQWKNVEKGYLLRQDVTVHCTDGDETIVYRR